MVSPQPSRLRRLFDQAFELPAADRAAWLARACEGDVDLQQRVLAMLDAAEDDRRFLTEPTGAPPASPPPPPAQPSPLPTEGPGAQIGPYRLLYQLGEGGFGAVYLAEQNAPVARRVALKIVKLGMDTRQVVARFEQERQALALMDHPNIARVLDAGATATGRPYFVMDLVKGAPIVEYCDQNHLPIADRLQLFAQVCSAVQHAHGKGIIHRDLKPSNILVAAQDGSPQVKVIDFGIAKATLQKLTDKTLFTEHQQVIGTLQYMSPEQAEGSLDIDTRTDIYSLGVLLYELLTGSTPFDKRTVRGALFGELQRMIREVEPPRPSTRLHQSSDTLANIAAQRRTEPRRLGALLRGELDWIVMKALEKDRGRRYQTANGLAMDILRHLAGEPVVAAPPSAAYRLRKAVQRHKGLVAAGTAIAATLLCGALAFAWQAVVARGERDAAELARQAEADQRRIADQQRLRAETNEREARTRAEELAAVAQFQADMLAGIDPTTAGVELSADLEARLAAALAAEQPPLQPATQKELAAGFRAGWQRINATDTARDLLDRTLFQPAIAAIAEKFPNQPLVAAALLQSLAENYRRFGLYDAALPLQQQALAKRQLLLGAEHLDTLASLAASARLLGNRGDYAEAEAAHREVLATRLRLLGTDHPETLSAMSGLGELLWSAGRSKEAEPLLRDALERHRRILGDDHEETLVVINNLGLLLAAQDRHAEAEPFYRESLQRSTRVLGPDHPDTVVSINNMGWLLQAQDRHAEAEPYFVEALAKRRRISGMHHPTTLNSINNLGMILHMRGNLQAAEPLLREALTLRQHILGDDHPSTLISYLNLGMLLRDRGEFDAAAPLLELCVAANRRRCGDAHADTLIATIALGGLRLDQQRPADTVALLAPAEASARRAFPAPPSIRRLATLLTHLGTARARLARAPSDFQVAAGTLAEAFELQQTHRGLEHRQTRACGQALVELHAAWHVLEPTQGHDAVSAQWQTRLASKR